MRPEPAPRTPEQKAQLSALAAFDAEARRLKLHYILIKGFALSQVVYKSPFERNSSDVDVMVSHSDLPKADLAARRAGFVQAMEAPRARQLLAAGALDEQLLKGIAAPHLYRTSPAAPHVTPYHRFGDDGYALLEIHDRFHRLDIDNTGALLWDTQTVELPGFAVQTCSTAGTLMLLMLSIHDDAETVRANMGRTTFARHSIDELHELLGLISHSTVYACAKMCKRLHVKEACEEALGDLFEVFPEDLPLVHDCFHPKSSIWHGSYLERLSDRERRAKSSFEVIRRALALYERAHPAAEDAGSMRLLPAADGSGDTSFSFSVIRRGNVWFMKWGVPKALGQTLDDIVLLTTILPGRNANSFGARYRVFRSEDHWACMRSDISAMDFDEHANKRARGDAIDVQVFESERETSVEFSVSENQKAIASPIPSVHMRQCASHYHPIAGTPFSTVLSEAFGLLK